MRQLRRIFRDNARRLASAPLFTITTLLTIALGVGASTAVFSVVNGILLNPLPFPESDRLLAMWHTAPGLDIADLSQSPATYLTYRADSELLDDIALWAGRAVTVSDVEGPEEVEALLVTDGFLDVLRVNPVMGRDFLGEDDLAGAPATILVTYGYWQRALGGTADVVGRTLTVSGTPREIIGVLPRDFRFMDRSPEILFPARFDPAEVFMGQFSFNGIARMNPGVTQAQVEAEVDRLARVAVERYPGPVTQSVFDQARIAPNLRPLKDDLVGGVRSILWVLLGAVGLVLLIACANVANLFLVRGEGRDREIAVRRALGAGGRDLASLFFSEAMLFAGSGGVVGVALAYGGIRLLRTIGPGRLPRLDELGMDLDTLLFAGGVTLAAGLAFGLLSLARSENGPLSARLREGGRGGSHGPEARRMRAGLIVGQVALALVLLIASGLMLRSISELRNVSPGFSAPAASLTFRLGIPEASVGDPYEAFGIHERVLREVEALAGVAAVGAASSLPLDGNDEFDALFVESQPVDPGTIPPVRRFIWTVPGHFEAMGIPVIAGRDLAWDDFDLKRRVVVVSESMAREVWGGVDAALRDRVSVIQLEGGDPVWYEVVGVVGDVHDAGLSSPVVPIVYWPAVQDEMYGAGPEVQRTLTYVVRGASGATDGLIDQVRGVVSLNAPGVAVAGVGTLGELVDRSLARTAFALVMLTIAATVAIVLGVVGLYGVVSYTVSHRRREIGIRLAVGAKATQVGGMIVNEGLKLAGIGVMLGWIGAVGLTRWIESLLYGVSPLDSRTFLGAAAILTGLALLASWIPARRAASVDPAITLREE